MQILLSAGHSDTDPGAPGAGQTEAEVAVEMRNLIAEKLRAAGVNVITDGDGAKNQPLSDVIKMIAGKALAVELHCNSVLDQSARGTECVALPDKKVIAQNLAATVASVLGIRLRGVAGFITQEQSARGKLGFVANGGLILEMFFLSNPGERELYRQRKTVLASALADAIRRAASC